ncbi:MAG: antibiotic biosynthesis monooxygenase family protein [Parvibaculum sp.]
MSTSEESARPVCVIVIARARDGQRNEILAAFKRSKSQIEQIDGCLQFDVHYGVGDQKSVLVYEKWQSIELHREAFNRITSDESFAAFRGNLEADLHLTYYHEV